MVELTPAVASRMLGISSARQVLKARGLPLPVVSPLELALRPAPKQRMSTRTLYRQVMRGGRPGKR